MKDLNQKLHKKYHLFDWDDNLVDMPTKIVYFAKDESAQFKKIYISTDLFASTRKKVGEESFPLYIKVEEGTNHAVAFSDEVDNSVKIDVKDYKIIYENDASFEEFRDGENNNFLRDLKKALTNLETALSASWVDFVEAMSDKEHADHTYIITARGQSRQAVYAGVKYLQSIKMIKNVLPKENIFCVSNKEELPKEFSGTADNPSETKKNVIKHIIQKAEEDAKQCPHGRVHSLGFSDDDPKTFETLKNFFHEIVQDGLINNLKLKLYFTGNKEREKHIISK